MSKAKRRAEREERRRQKRAQRSIARPRNLDVEVMAAWATPELASRISGRIDVALAVRIDAGRSAWTYVRISLLAGGYLGTASVERAVPIAELMSSEPIQPFGEGSIEPVGIELASELVWGAFAWSQLRGALGDHCLPALGALPPPIGTFEDWAEALESRFSAHQLELADAIVAQKDTENSFDDAEVPTVAFAMLEVPSPHALARKLAQYPHLFAYDRRDGHYEWRPDLDDRSDGIVMIEGDTAIVRAISPADTARLATRMIELAPDTLSLRAAAWEPITPVEARVSQVLVRAR